MSTSNDYSGQMICSHCRRYPMAHGDARLCLDCRKLVDKSIAHIKAQLAAMTKERDEWKEEYRAVADSFVEENEAAVRLEKERDELLKRVEELENDLVWWQNRAQCRSAEVVSLERKHEVAQREIDSVSRVLNEVGAVLAAYRERSQG